MVKKKACLISGGGAWGAFGGGTLAKINGKYDTVVGVSTGSLLAPLTALREWEVLKEAYTNVDSSNIFDRCWYKGNPISKKGKTRRFPVIMTLLLGNKTICTSNVLRKTISSTLTETRFKRLRSRQQEVLVGTQNLAQVPSKIHYFSSMDESYEDFIDWTWCSANYPFFTSLIKKSWRDAEGKFHIGQWSDGGISDLVGIDQLQQKGYKDIDIIVHRTRVQDRFEGERVHDLIDNFNASVSAMRYDVEFEHFYERIRRLNKKGVKVTVYWLPRKLSANPMVFDKQQMTEWWEEGYETAFDPDRVEIFGPIEKRF